MACEQLAMKIQHIFDLVHKAVKLASPCMHCSFTLTLIQTSGTSPVVMSQIILRKQSVLISKGNTFSWVNLMWDTLHRPLAHISSKFFCHSVVTSFVSTSSNYVYLCNSRLCVHKIRNLSDNTSISTVHEYSLYMNIDQHALKLGPDRCHAKISPPIDTCDRV